MRDAPLFVFGADAVCMFSAHGSNRKGLPNSAHQRVGFRRSARFVNALFAAGQMPTDERSGTRCDRPTDNTETPGIARNYQYFGSRHRESTNSAQTSEIAGERRRYSRRDVRDNGHCALGVDLAHLAWNRLGYPASDTCRREFRFDKSTGQQDILKRDVSARVFDQKSLGRKGFP